MKKKEKASLHAASPAELSKIIGQAEAKLAQYNVTRYSKQSKNVREAGALRNNIAIAKTLLRYKQLQHE